MISARSLFLILSLISVSNMGEYKSPQIPDYINPGLEESIRAASLLSGGRNTNFVKRLMNPTAYPIHEFDKEGNYGTHLMGSAGPDESGKYMVYPNIVYNEMTGRLNLLEPKEAPRYAKRTGEYISLDNAEDAEWLGENYKKGIPKMRGGFRSSDTGGMGDMMRSRERRRLKEKAREKGIDRTKAMEYYQRRIDRMDQGEDVPYPFEEYKKEFER